MFYEHKELWSRRSGTFCVEVSRHENRYQSSGPNVWCVYIYLYAKHPRFVHVASGGELGFDLHGGETYRRIHRNEKGNPSCVQIGCDYNHLYDERFTDFDTKEDALEVFFDADKLFAWADAQTATEPDVSC